MADEDLQGLFDNDVLDFDALTGETSEAQLRVLADDPVMPVEESNEEIDPSLYSYGGSPISMLTRHSSSLLDEDIMAPRVSFRSLLEAKASQDPRAYGRLLELQAQAAATHQVTHNPLDSRLSDVRLMELISELRGAEARVLGGSEVAIIICGREAHSRKEDEPGRRLAAHLNATPMDGLVFITVPGREQEIRRDLLARGLREGADYEILQRSSLTSQERQVLQGMMTGTRNSLRILRKLSMRMARV